jgi:hypothetical protein
MDGLLEGPPGIGYPRRRRARGTYSLRGRHRAASTTATTTPCKSSATWQKCRDDPWRNAESGEHEWNAMLPAGPAIACHAARIRSSQKRRVLYRTRRAHCPIGARCCARVEVAGKPAQTDFGAGIVLEFRASNAQFARKPPSRYAPRSTSPRATARQGRISIPLPMLRRSSPVVMTNPRFSDRSAMHWRRPASERGSTAAPSLTSIG